MMLATNTIQKNHSTLPLHQILIVYDHPLMRKGFRSLINDTPDMVVCGEAANASEALDEIDRTHPDLLITGLHLGVSTGLELATVVRSVYTEIGIVVVSYQDAALYAERAQKAGADVYLERSDLIDKGVETFRSLLKPPKHAA